MTACPPTRTARDPSRFVLRVHEDGFGRSPVWQTNNRDTGSGWTGIAHKLQGKRIPSVGAVEECGGTRVRTGRRAVCSDFCLPFRFLSDCECECRCERDGLLT